MAAKHILACIDFSEASTSSLEEVGEYARANGSKVTLLHVADPQAFIPPQAVLEPPSATDRGAHEQELAKLRDAHLATSRSTWPWSRTTPRRARSATTLPTTTSTLSSSAHMAEAAWSVGSLVASPSGSCATQRPTSTSSESDFKGGGDTARLRTMGHRRAWSILGNSQRLDGGAMFGNAPRALWRTWVEPDELNRIPLACRALLIEDGNRKILFETGIGAFFPPRLRDRFGVQEERHVLLDNLQTGRLLRRRRRLRGALAPSLRSRGRSSQRIRARRAAEASLPECQLRRELGRVSTRKASTLSRPQVLHFGAAAPARRHRSPRGREGASFGCARARLPSSGSPTGTRRD